MQAPNPSSICNAIAFCALVVLLIGCNNPGAQPQAKQAQAKMPEWQRDCQMLAGICPENIWPQDLF